MKKFIYIFSVIFLISCNQVNENNKNIKQKDTTSISEKKENTFPVITDSNVVEILTQYGKENPETKVKISTKYGEIVVQLYEETPLHRANFIMLVKKKYFNGTMFYRVVKDLVIQGGDCDEPGFSNKKKAIGYYTIPAEFNSKFTHKRGALALAREYENNPEKRSSSFDFYICHKNSFHLNNEHTVFGEVISGFDVIDSIANLETDLDEWPIENVYIKMEVVE